MDDAEGDSGAHHCESSFLSTISGHSALNLHPLHDPDPDHRISVFSGRHLDSQEWDQKEHFGCKLLHQLTPAHFERSSFDRMNVGKAITILSREHARVIKMLRMRYCPHIGV